MDVVTVTVAIPAPFAVTTPFSTVTTEELGEYHVTLRSVAFAGVTAAVSVALPPTVSESSVLFSVTPVTSTVGTLTVTVQNAVLPLEVVTVTVAVPSPTAVILPFSTVATDGSDELHITDLSVVSSGTTVAVSTPVFPTTSDMVDLSNVTPAAMTTEFLTVTVQVAAFPLEVVAITTAVPAFFAVTIPFSTVATAVSELVHVTVLSVASAGITAAVNTSVSPTTNDRAGLSREMPETATVELVTVTVQIAVLPLEVVAIITAVPAPAAVTVPLTATATAGLEDEYVMLLSVVLDGSTVATNATVSPTVIVTAA